MRKGFFCLLLAWVALSSETAWGQVQGKRECELGYQNSIFTPSRWPDRSLEQFTQGSLGIIIPEFDRFYLFLAFRRVAGKAVTAQDLDRLRVFDPCWNDGSNSYQGKDWQSSSVMQSAQREWTAARAEAGLPAMVYGTSSYRSVMGYWERQIPNCNPDAFSNAARTLRARIATHGMSVWIRDWVEAQDRVMLLCFDAKAKAPNPAPTNAPSWLRADSDYQAAAADFYVGLYDASAQRFVAIAADASSPWQGWGLYLAARARLRQASGTPQDAPPTEAIRQEHLSQARELLSNALSTASDAGMRHDIARLLQRIRLQTESAIVMTEIDARLSSEALDANVGQDVRDFSPGSEEVSDFNPRDPGFGAWLQALRGAEVPADADIPSASTLALIAWLSNATPQTPRLAELLQRAAMVPRGSPAYPTAQFHRIRLLPDRTQGLRLARQMLTLSESELGIQDRNRIKALVLPLAQTASELATFAYREPISSWKRASGTPLVDKEGAAVLNDALPLDRLYALQVATTTPAPLRRELLGVVWTRALVLQRWDLLHKLQLSVQQALPQATALLQAIEQAPDVRERQARAALFLLLHPGLVGNLTTEMSYTRDPRELALPNMHRFYRQDGNRANWWCGLPSNRWVDSPTPAPPALPLFLSPREQRRWKAEYDQFVATPNATEFLAPLVLTWAKAHPRDPALPEALRMIVRSARGGCVTGQARGMGRDAFHHLHRYFPKSEAARETRSWS